jgi:hypothetical protein
LGLSHNGQVCGLYHGRCAICQLLGLSLNDRIDGLLLSL